MDGQVEKYVKKGRKGRVEYSVIRNPQAETDKPKKVLFMIPGAIGESEGGIMQLMSNNALHRGYHVFISNPLAPTNSD